MFDSRDLNDRGNCCAYRMVDRCSAVVIGILASLLFFVIGAIAGAYLASFITASIVPIAIFAIVLFLATIITIFLARCRCRE